jgi:GDP-D-mannose dehydratase
MTNLKKKRNKIKALITGVDGYLGSYIFNLLMKKKKHLFQKEASSLARSVR